MYAALVFPPLNYTWRRFKPAASVCSIKLLVYAPLSPYALKLYLATLQVRRSVLRRLPARCFKRKRRVGHPEHMRVMDDLRLSARISVSDLELLVYAAFSY